jgi:hypothetical protein
VPLDLREPCQLTCARHHGAVVAREYGIPAVVGVPGATTRLRTGERVRVDGGGGTVSVLDAADDSGRDGRPIGGATGAIRGGGTGDRPPAERS